MSKTNVVKRLLKKILLPLKALKGEYYVLLVKCFPSVHAKIEAKRQGHNKLVRDTDIKNPIFFSEKILYLKYNLYNNSNIIAKCYNKYEVRDYVIQKGCGQYLNELYGVWDSVNEIPWETLPSEFVIKVTNGYSGHVFKRKGVPFSVEEAKQKLSTALSSSSFRFKISGDLFAYKTKQKIICEKLLHSNFGFMSPEDYKFHCFHGKPKFIEIMWDRYGNHDKLYNESLVDLNFNDRYELEAEAGPKPDFDIIPECIDEMIEIAQKLSADFPYVRVDLYVSEEKPVFGELTFTPFFAQTGYSMYTLGQLINLNDIYKYKKLLL